MRFCFFSVNLVFIDEFGGGGASEDSILELGRESLRVVRFLHRGELFGPPGRGRLGQRGNDQGAYTESERNHVHGKGDGGGAENPAQGWIADNRVLNVELDEQHDEEPPVMVDAREHVDFSVGNGANLARVDHVEEVHDHERVEEEGVVDQAQGRCLCNGVSEGFLEHVVPHVEHGRGRVQQHDHRDELVNDLR